MAVKCAERGTLAQSRELAKARSTHFNDGICILQGWLETVKQTKFETSVKHQIPGDKQLIELFPRVQSRQFDRQRRIGAQSNVTGQ